jgi:hypothetical protein
MSRFSSVGRARQLPALMIPVLISILPLQALFLSSPVFLAVDWITSSAQILQSFKELLSVIWDDFLKSRFQAASKPFHF